MKITVRQLKNVVREVVKRQKQPSAIAVPIRSEFEHGDMCPKCGDTIISKPGQFEHLKCRTCGFVPIPSDAVSSKPDV